MIVHRRQSRGERKSDDANPICTYERVATNIKSLRSLKGLEGGCDIFCSPDFQCGGLKSELASQCLNLGHLKQGTGADIGQDRKPAETRDDLAQKFETLAGKIGILD